MLKKIMIIAGFLWVASSFSAQVFAATECPISVTNLAVSNKLVDVFWNMNEGDFVYDHHDVSFIPLNYFENSEDSSNYSFAQSHFLSSPTAEGIFSDYTFENEINFGNLVPVYLKFDLTRLQAPNVTFAEISLESEIPFESVTNDAVNQTSQIKRMSDLLNQDSTSEPAPPIFFLLASGLIGLAGFSRKSKANIE